MACKKDQIKYKIISCGLFFRGATMAPPETIIQRQFISLRKSSFLHKDTSPSKVNYWHSSHASSESSNSMTCLLNSSGINETFKAVKHRFLKLYRNKAMLHHFTKYCEISEFEEAIIELDDIIRCYEEIGH